MSGSATGFRQRAELQQHPSLRCLVMDEEIVMSVGDLFLVEGQYLSVSFSALTLLVGCKKAIRPIKSVPLIPIKVLFFRSSEGRKSKGELATTGPPGKWLMKQKWWPGFYAPHGPGHIRQVSLPETLSTDGGKSLTCKNLFSSPRKWHQSTETLTRNAVQTEAALQDARWQLEAKNMTGKQHG